MKSNDLEKVFLQSYDDYADAIFRHCYFKLSDREIAKDLTQDVFIKTWEYLGKNGEVENIRAFLYKVANNLIIDNYRKKKTISLEKLQESGYDPGIDERQSMQNKITAEETIKFFEKLEEDDREALTMRYIEDLSPKEIASILDESENVVSVRIHRALKKLRQIIEHEQ